MVILGYDAATIGSSSVQVPDLVERLYRSKGASDEFRKNRNNVLFLVADVAQREAMFEAMRRQLALEQMRKPDRRGLLQPHQQRLMSFIERASMQ
ncbi:MAG: hypothetical protein U5P10_07990 [Spirochaetia bacterium]|nr:hypothetical protein [Spirochaetia bacterium]